jgi:hypothetical protein
MAINSEKISDSQLVEILGRNKLVSDLLRARIEVAIPQRDNGIDLIAFVVDREVGLFKSKPIQMKAATNKSFLIERKYEKLPELIMAYIWNVQTYEDSTTYAMTYADCLLIAEHMGWTETNAWRQGNRYSTQAPSEKLIKLLQPHLIDSADRWRELVCAS